MARDSPKSIIKRRRKPQKLSKDNKTIRIEFRVSIDEYNKITEECKKAGITKSTYLRKLINKQKIKEKPDNKFFEIIPILREIVNKQDRVIRYSEENKKYEAEQFKNEAKELLLKIEKDYLK